MTVAAMPTTATLDIRLLGGFALTHADGQGANVSTPRLQSLLAYLVLHRDAPQPRAHLAYLFWPDASEAQARNNLRQTLHALRLALAHADAFLLADANTLRWRPDAPYRLDVAEFEAALALAGAQSAQEHDAARRAALERAISIYQGDLVPSCYDAWIAPERERLRQRYLDGLGQLITLLEARRDYASAIDHARRLCAHDPLGEEGCRVLMRLLMLTGDRSGALRAYHSCAGALERDLGVAPSPETVAAYEQVRQMPEAPPPAADERPSDERATWSLGGGALIGRQPASARLMQAWQRACAGEPGIVLVTGEAGIGKSRLAEELVLSARQQGASTAKTRCYAAEGRLSLAPVTDWLRDDDLRPHLGHLDNLWLSELSRILPEVAREYPGLPARDLIGEYGQRQRFFEALARAVLAAPQPLLLVIDDLQWCDQETLEWLHFLLRFDPFARFLLVGTARPEELPPEHPLHRLMLDLHRGARATEIALQPLDAAETARLAALIAGSPLDVPGALRLFDETEGNPLFVVETMRAGFVRRLAEQRTHGDVPLDETDVAPQNEVLLGSTTAVTTLPPRVLAVLSARLAQVSPSARDLAALAAVVGREFRLEVLVGASTASEDVVVRALDELWQRHIIREQGTNIYDFTHDKLREVAYAEISAPQRRLLHRRVAQALEAVHSADLDPVSGQIAAHYDRAGLYAQALPYYQRAADIARRRYANDDAIALLTRALRLLEHVPGGAARDALELRLLLVLTSVYRITRGWTAPELALATNRILVLCVDADDEVRAEALYGWHSLLVVQARLEQVLSVSDELQALYARLGHDAPPLAGMMVAGARLHLGQVVEANEMFGGMAGASAPLHPSDVERAQDALGWDYAVHSRAWQAHALWCLGFPEQALERGLEAQRYARELAMPFNQALAATYLAMLYQFRGGVSALHARAEEALALSTEYRAPYYRVWSAILFSFADAWKHPDAPHRTQLRQAIDALMATGARLRLPYYLWLLASADAKAGRVAEGVTALDEACAVSAMTGERWWDAELHRLRGRFLIASGADDRDVEAEFAQASQIARAQQARSLELRAALSLARWEHGRGQTRQAAATRVREIYAWFTEGFETPDLRAARAFLAEHEGGDDRPERPQPR